MAAFDVTTKPTSLSLKPGSTGSIMVVVSNRLGRPVMGFVEGVITPASAARWVVPPPDQQRPYPADPSATVTHEFKIAVPPDAPAQVAYFKATARDVLAPDDTRSDGQTVAINVTPDAVPPPTRKKKLPWWVWLIAGLVVVGVGIGVYLICCGKKAEVPNVVGMTVEDASEELTTAGFDSLVVKDTVGDRSRDTNRVIRQEPPAGGEMPKDDGDEKVVATIVVNRLGRVPLVVGKDHLIATIILRAAGFAPITVKDSLVPKSGFPVLGNPVLKQQPEGGSELPPNSMRGKTPATIWVRRATTVVPNIVGKKESVAISLLNKAGLDVGRTSRRSQIFIPSGMILEVSPSAGKVVPRGSAVNLVISR